MNLLAGAVLLAVTCWAAFGPLAGGPPETLLATRLRRMAAEAPVVVAHRGASAACPENTLPAFRRAIGQGAGMIELDVRQTRDGVWVCLHDATLDRTTDIEERTGRRDVAVTAVTAAELGELDAGSWKATDFAGTAPPTLEEALSVIQDGSIAMIEHKDGAAADMVALLRRLDLVDDVLVQSFDWEFLRAVHELEPELTLGALGPTKGARRLDEATEGRIAGLGAVLVHWNRRELRVEDVDRLHDRDLLVCTYTIDDDPGLIGAAAMGVDLVTTNRPDRLAALAKTGPARRRRR